MSRRLAPICALVLALAACTGNVTPAPTTIPAPSASVPPSPSPSPSPSEAAVTWPAAVTETDFMNGTPVAAVWLVIGPPDTVGSWDAIRSEATAAGYDVAALPVGCHDASQTALGNPELTIWDADWGLPVFFASDADAAEFVTLWTGAPPVVVGVGHVQCDFD